MSLQWKSSCVIMVTSAACRHFPDRPWMLIVPAPHNSSMPHLLHCTGNCKEDFPCLRIPSHTAALGMEVVLLTILRSTSLLLNSRPSAPALPYIAQLHSSAQLKLTVLIATVLARSSSQFNCYSFGPLKLTASSLALPLHLGLDLIAAPTWSPPVSVFLTLGWWSAPNSTYMSLW